LQERHLRGNQSGKKAIGSEWRILISYYLLDNPLRFNDLLRKGKPDDLNARTLSRTLKYLQNMGIVERTVVGTEPFSVVYSLTERGRDLGDILSPYRRWGEKWTPSIVHPLPYPKVRATPLTRLSSR
jgi:DNA-binding HxlR family transcriptional regulator